MQFILTCINVLTELCMLSAFYNTFILLISLMALVVAVRLFVKP